MKTDNINSVYIDWQNTPINFQYTKPNNEIIQQLITDSSNCQIESSHRIHVGNDYYQQSLAGTHAKTFTRLALLKRLQTLAEFLPDNCQLYIFDAFRTIATQTVLYHDFKKELGATHPHLTDDELEQLTRRYVSHPTDATHWPIPLHNSGGAIDLAIMDANSKQQWDFGTAIDTTHEMSATDFFEQAYDPEYDITEQRWNKIRQNRRVLYHAMCNHGFVNYRAEWWHFDLGNCNWAKEFGIDWVYNSLEHELDL